MRRALAWIAGLAGIAALGRAAARRLGGSRAPAAEAPGVDETAAQAAELRARLDAKRDREEAREGADAASPASSESIEERRARVHAKAKEALDAMREPDA